MDFAVRGPNSSNVIPRGQNHTDSMSWARERFLEEGRTLASLHHPAILPVHDILELNETVYLVTEFVDGQDFEQWLRGMGRPATEEELRPRLWELLEALHHVHEKSYLHRDIKPQNILIRRDNGRPVLIDFGNARMSTGQHTQNLTAVVSRGYAPFEQYQTKGRQGPPTDLYALGAVFFRAVTGQAPEDSSNRVDDDPVPALSHIGWPGFSKAFLSQIDKALMCRSSDRWQTAHEWMCHIQGKAAVKIPARPHAVPLAPVAPPKQKSQKPSQPPPPPRTEATVLHRQPLTQPERTRPASVPPPVSMPSGSSRTHPQLQSQVEPKQATSKPAKVIPLAAYPPAQPTALPVAGPQAQPVLQKTTHFPWVPVGLGAIGVAGLVYALVVYLRQPPAVVAPEVAKIKVPPPVVPIPQEYPKKKTIQPVPASLPRPKRVTLSSGPQPRNLAVRFNGTTTQPQFAEGKWVLDLPTSEKDLEATVEAVGYAPAVVNIMYDASQSSIALPPLRRKTQTLKLLWNGSTCDYDSAEINWEGPLETESTLVEAGEVKGKLISIQQSSTNIELPTGTYTLKIQSSRTKSIASRVIQKVSTGLPVQLPKSWLGAADFVLKSAPKKGCQDMAELVGSEPEHRLVQGILDRHRDATHLQANSYFRHSVCKRVGPIDCADESSSRKSSESHNFTRF